MSLQAIVEGKLSILMMKPIFQIFQARYLLIPGHQAMRLARRQRGTILSLQVKTLWKKTVM
jgi:hypothetical protein